MLFDPRVQVKAIEGDPLLPDWNDDQPRANVAVEHPASDTAVGRGVAIADQPGLQRDGHSEPRIVRKTSITQRWCMRLEASHACSRHIGPRLIRGLNAMTVHRGVRTRVDSTTGGNRSATRLRFEGLRRYRVVSEVALMHGAPVTASFSPAPS